MWQVGGIGLERRLFFALTTQENTDLHGFLVNHGTHEKHGKDNLKVAV